MTDGDDYDYDIVEAPDPLENRGWTRRRSISTVDRPVYPSVVNERLVLDSLDVSNTLAINIFQVVCDQINALTDQISDYPIDGLFLNDGKALSNYYMINTMSSSLYQSALYLLLTQPLCFQDSEKGDEIVFAFEDEGDGPRSYKVRNAETPENKRIQSIGKMRDLRTADLEDLVETHLDVDLDPEEIYGDQKQYRNRTVHNFIHLMMTQDWNPDGGELLDRLYDEDDTEVQTIGDFLERYYKRDKMINICNDWRDYVLSLNEILAEELILNESLKINNENSQ